MSGRLPGSSLSSLREVTLSVTGLAGSGVDASESRVDALRRARGSCGSRARPGCTARHEGQKKTEELALSVSSPNRADVIWGAPLSPQRGRESWRSSAGLGVGSSAGAFPRRFGGGGGGRAMPRSRRYFLATCPAETLRPCVASA